MSSWEREVGIELMFMSPPLVGHHRQIDGCDVRPKPFTLLHISHCIG